MALRLAALFALVAAGAMALVYLPQSSRLGLAKEVVRARFASVPRISVPRLTEWMAASSPAKPVLLDVRTEAEFNVSHLPGARRVEDSADAAVLLQSLPKDQPIAAYCALGWRSSKLVERLQSAGATNVFNLDGTIFAWAVAGGALESGGQAERKVHPFNAVGRWLLRDDLEANVPAISPVDSNVATLLKRKSSVSLFILVLLLSWESVKPFFAYFRGQVGVRLIHALKNFIVGTLNSVVISTFIATVWLWTSEWTAAHRFGLFHWVALPDAVRLALSVLVLDVWMYKWHWMNHRFRFLWRFHRLHHTDAQMDVTTASRFHLGEILFSSLLRVPLLLLTGIQLWQVVLYEGVLFAVVQFQHANVSLPARLDGVLRQFIVTPAMHKIHHSRVQRETDSNYASLFSWWDRLFGTFVWREDQSKIQLGLDGWDAREKQSLVGMVATPVGNAERGTRNAE